jgi:hypothetical protein
MVDTLIGGKTDDDAFWHGMLLWAAFKPRAASPRTEPGQLYYPAAATHIIQKYWDYLNDPSSHPDCDESEFTKDRMQHFAAALSDMDLSSFEPSVDSEAPDKACRIAQMAAASRRLPIQDARDFWEPPGNAPEECSTVSGAPRLVRTVTMLTPDREGLYITSQLGRYDQISGNTAGCKGIAGRRLAIGCPFTGVPNINK